MKALSAPRWSITIAADVDRSSWGSLYRAYAASAGAIPSDAHLATVWSWIMSAEGQTRCSLLRLPNQAVVGLAHYRVFERPLDGSYGCYLDDLYVAERQRGRGGARALLDHLHALADEQSWTTVRWTTKETNPAKSLYDSLAERMPVITYNMAPGVDRAPE